ncbi:hypothetical protein SEPCBS119000_004461 [Sporothrix epigloea]|uniref:Transmembrane protein n=1 Tax=Sporothrix epigloea TaxID=1892477 RepID=A0ABP0DW53_9PEZI
MTGQLAVQNFSLPSRTGSLRTYSPSAGDDRDSHGGDSDSGTVTGLRFDRAPRRFQPPALTPAASALHLFQFDNRVEPPSGPRSRVLLRPMSTSSSAPALTALCDNINSHAREHQELQEEVAEISCGFSPAENDVQQVGVQRRSQQSVPASSPSPTKNSWQSAMVHIDGDKPRSRQTSTHAGVLDSACSTDNDLPDLAHSLSIHRGPRLRHITLSEIHAADDAARRVASVRRERRVFWLLVALALVGVLSCPGAVTLAVAQAAMQNSVEETGPNEYGGNLIWNSRTLGWLVASLLVSVSATVGLAVATSARCRRRRDAVCCEDTYTAAGEEAILAQLVQSSTRGRQSVLRRDCAFGVGSRCSQRFSALLSSSGLRQPDPVSQPQESRETRTASPGWLAMDDTDSKQANSTGPLRWWPFNQLCKQDDAVAEFAGAVNNDCNVGSARINDRITPRTSDQIRDEKSDGVLAEKAITREEDRNWNKFTQDPVQLRRYVETLETRLAAVEGIQRVL